MSQCSWCAILCISSLLGEVVSLYAPTSDFFFYIGTVDKEGVDLEGHVVVVEVVDLEGDKEVEEDVGRSYLKMILMQI